MSHTNLLYRLCSVLCSVLFGRKIGCSPTEHNIFDENDKKKNENERKLNANQRKMKRNEKK